MENEETNRRRHAAGNDPAKREAILHGAARAFSENGFDGASVNDICRLANVSKSTMYVYFNGKEEVFEALLDRERTRAFKDLEEILDADQEIRVKLYRFTFALVKLICSAEVVRSQRTVIAMAERMPDLCTRFYESGPLRMRRLIQGFLEEEVAKGVLEIQDISLASHHLIELSTAGLWRQCLFGVVPVPPPEKTMIKSSRSAADTFLTVYLKA